MSTALVRPDNHGTNERFVGDVLIYFRRIKASPRLYIYTAIYTTPRGAAVMRISIPGTRRACTTHFARLYDDDDGGQTDAHLSVTFRQDDVPPVIGPYDDLRRFYHTTRARIRRTS